MSHYGLESLCIPQINFAILVIQSFMSQVLDGAADAVQQAPNISAKSPCRCSASRRSFIDAGEEDKRQRTKLHDLLIHMYTALLQPFEQDLHAVT